MNNVVGVVGIAGVLGVVGVSGFSELLTNTYVDGEALPTKVVKWL